MNTARYKDSDGILKNIYADEITKIKYEKVYKGNLYCEYSDCDAELIYNEKQKRKFKKYFSTRRGSKHKIGCPNEIYHNGSKASVIKVKGENINISDKHISNVLSDAYVKFYKKLNGDDDKKHRDGTRKKQKKTETTDKNKKPIVEKTSTPTTDGKGSTRVGEREPFIYKREVSDIGKWDKNSFKEVHGLVKNIKLFDNEVYIDLAGLDGNEISVYIGTPFKSSYKKEFELLHNLKVYISQQKKFNRYIICTSVGQIMELDSKLVVQVYKWSDIRIDNLNLYKINEILRN